MGPGLGDDSRRTLSEHWLSDRQTSTNPLHAKYAPGTPIRITETADAAAAAIRGAPTFLDRIPLRRSDGPVGRSGA